MNIYEVTTAYGKQLQELEMMSDLPEEALKDTKEALTECLIAHGKDHVAVMLNIDAEIKQMKEAITKIKARLSIKEAHYYDLEHQLIDAMKTKKMPKIACAEFEVNLRKNAASLDIEDELLIPPEYFITKTDIKVDNKKVKDALKDGIKITGASLVHNYSLQIK